jgi:hypothetical protein
LYISLSKTRGVLRLLLGGIIGVLPASRRSSIARASASKGFICQCGIGFHLRQEHVGAFKIMHLTAGQEEWHQVLDISSFQIYT